jgi:hypothetical protein
VALLDRRWRAGRRRIGVREELSRRIHSLGLASRVQLLGDRDDAGRLLASADIYCQPNDGPEPFGLSFVEALAAGLPVVSTMLGAIPEIVDDTCGVLVAPRAPEEVASALSQLLGDPSGDSVSRTAPARAPRRLVTSPGESTRWQTRSQTHDIHHPCSRRVSRLPAGRDPIAQVRPGRHHRRRLHLRHRPGQLPGHVDVFDVRRRHRRPVPGQLWKPLTPAQRLGSHDLRIWVAVLIGWPVLLFIAFPTDNPLVQAVGLRANAFLLPFLLFGARLTSDDVKELALYLAVLNLAAVALATVEFFIGIEPFYPMNDVTDIIYRSRDLVGRTAYRIPACFSSAHAFAGAMAMTLPVLIGGGSSRTRGSGKRRCWRRP